MSEKKFIQDVLAELEDGFQSDDLYTLLPVLMEYAGTFRDLDGPSRKEKVLSLIDIIIDETDQPGPDLIVDPLLKMFSKKLLGKLIDKFYDVFKGKFSF